ncbi:MAG: 4Fe-4S binding protein [Oscillospiraceae bacterium]|nr:4Fe-4S binding protein [Oscillospiraceae bacterium]
MRVTVGMGSCGIAAGADKVYTLLREKGLSPVITGCNGMCYLEPIVTVDEKVYTRVDETKIDDIVNTKNEACVTEPEPDSFKIALRNCGVIDPENIDEYIEKGGYKASEKCVTELSSEQIIELVKTSGIGGRGGAGFPTWFKWNAARNSPGEEKYIICNADEGDPGAFMDRAILEGDPHSVLEGMIIAAKAISGDNTTTVKGIIYVRAEYPLAIKRLTVAIVQAQERGYLDARFNVRIKAGAGAFVCGEETALIASLEGERGMPRLKPPFPAEKGYKQKPSNINNVETFANIPWIINNGGDAFAKIGIADSKGTKVFALTGKVVKGGLVEVPMGKTIREVVYNEGGGIIGGKKLKAVQLGGPSGGCIPEELLDTQIGYKSLSETGAIMGSGGMVVMDDSTCMVDMARYFLDFTCKESCGKCTHCRIGNKRMLEILERICDGKGKDGDIQLLEELGRGIKAGSLCALGQSAPNPVLTTIKYFKNEYEAHIKQKKCPAHSCKALLTYSIDPNKCKRCNLCVKKCPANAITDLIIDNGKCTKCGSCFELCKFGAITDN